MVERPLGEHRSFERAIQGRKIRGSQVEDLAWFRPDGEPMTEEEWDEGFARSLRT